jgi:Family of unknown function (DUF5522)
VGEHRDRLRLTDIDEPRSDRLPPSHPRYDEVLAAHRAAVDQRAPAYRDPYSGLMVFTSRFLAERGYCCASGCRHCPFEP